MDKLSIIGIKLVTLIGIHAWEQHYPQRLTLDISFQIDAQRIATDNIQEAIDYQAVLNHIQAFVEKTPCQLLETLAQKIAAEILREFPTQWVHIVLHKPGALLAAKDVIVSIERSKQ